MIGIVNAKAKRKHVDEDMYDPKKRKIELRRSNRIRRTEVEEKKELKREEENEEQEKENIIEVIQPKPIEVHSSYVHTELSDYEKLRLKNIEENQKFFASLEIFKTKEDMMMGTPKIKKPSSRGLKSEKKPAEPIILRPRSLRLQRIDPSGDPLPKIEFTEPVEEHPRKPAGPLDMTPTNIKNENKENLSTDFSKCMECLQNQLTETESPDMKMCVLPLLKLGLTEERVAKVVPNRIFSLDVHRSASKLIIGVGGKWGHLGIWDVESKNENDGVFLFEPHSRPINCFKFAPMDCGKFLSCSYDGTVRCGDLNKLVFEDVYCTNPDEDQWLSYFDFLSPDGSQLLIGQNMKAGYAALIDRRTNSSPVQTYKLHDRNVKTVSIHPLKKNYFVTASTDTTVALWDLRMLSNEGKNKPLSYLPHLKTVSSAFFSPVTGSQVLTTSVDDRLRIADFDMSGSTQGLNLKTTIRHNNHTGRWLSSFRAQWHPRLEDVFVVGSMDRPRRIELFSTDGTILHNYMEEEFLSSVCSVNAFHPSRNILIGGNSSGRVHVFM
ncbi:WD repeat-containing protein 76-like isoform X2 [Anneissia japonica]|uniref:WD repeat-containing protein 76-like isoform X2 n=1 Tax=Anneissia japonica TaxID=1529436 RepID=UPI0014254E04|nr:WD repeat-containing protein 76-like isoform X2 [Anneissia japonica]